MCEINFLRLSSRLANPFGHQVRTHACKFASTCASVWPRLNQRRINYMLAKTLLLLPAIMKFSALLLIAEVIWFTVCRYFMTKMLGAKFTMFCSPQPYGIRRRSSRLLIDDPRMSPATNKFAPLSDSFSRNLHINIWNHSHLSTLRNGCDFRPEISSPLFMELMQKWRLLISIILISSTVRQRQ